MTILALLMALAISHFARDIRHARRYGFAVDGIAAISRWLTARVPGHGWLLVLVLILILLVVCWLLLSLAGVAPGQIGYLLLALVVLLYTLGPQDLDTEVEALLEGDGDDAIEQWTSDNDTPAQKVVREAMDRWFGVIFWFVVLNIVGALLYRLTSEFVRREHEHDESWTAMKRLLALLQWPVAQLMTLALAISADFDRVWSAWRHWHAEHGWRPFGCGMLLSAAEDVAGGDDWREAVARAMQLAWRILIAWLVVLSILFLAGWII